MEYIMAVLETFPLTHDDIIHEAQHRGRGSWGRCLRVHTPRWSCCAPPCAHAGVISPETWRGCPGSRQSCAIGDRQAKKERRKFLIPLITRRMAATIHDQYCLDLKPTSGSESVRLSLPFKSSTPTTPKAIP
jgi:hypothetical protein